VEPRSKTGFRRASEIGKVGCLGPPLQLPLLAAVLSTSQRTPCQLPVAPLTFAVQRREAGVLWTSPVTDLSFPATANSGFLTLAR